MRAGALRLVSLIAAGDIKLTFRYRSVILWVFIMPVIFMGFFGVAFRGGGGKPRARITVDDRDGDFLSRALIRELRKEPLDVVDTLAAGENPIRTLIIPADFTRRVLSREPVKIIVRVNEGSNVEAGAAVNAALYRCVIRIAADLISIEAAAIERGLPHIAIRGDSLVGSLWAVAAARPDSIGFISIALDSLTSKEPLVTMNAAEAGAAREAPRGFMNSVPGMLVMFVLMAMVFSGAGISAERTAGVFRRFAYTPAGGGTVVAGKLASRMAVAALQIAFLLAVGRFAFGVPLGHSAPGIVLLMLAFAFCTGALSLLFGALLRNPEQVSGIGVVSTLIMASLGGCWWPLEIVPDPFRVIAFFFPTGWAINGLHKLVSFGYGLPAVLMNVAVLAAFGALFLAIASAKLKWTD